MDKIDLCPALGEGRLIKAQKTLLDNPGFLEKLCFRGRMDDFKNFYSSFSCEKDYNKVLKIILEKLYLPLIKATSSGVEVEGLDNLKKDKAYIFVSTHRDIVMDSLLVGFELFLRGYKEVCPVVGSNLKFSEFATSCFDLLYSIYVDRTLVLRSLFDQSKVLSSLITDFISTNHHSVWIAGGAGRSKDGLDIVKSSVIKMLYLCKLKEKSFKELLLDYQIVPLSISYEYDPCAVFRAYTQSNEGYVKTPRDDIFCIQKGMSGYKGKITLKFAPPIKPEDIVDELNFDNVSTFIQNKIRNNFKLYPNNYTAWDAYYANSDFKEYHNNNAMSYFSKYSFLKPEAFNNFIHYYAAPVSYKFSGVFPK